MKKLNGRAVKNFIYSSCTPLILICLMAFGIVDFLSDSEAATLKEKVSDMVLFVDSEAAQVFDMVQLDDDWGRYDYGTMIAHAAAYYDARPMTFAAAYDLEYNCISERYESIEGVPFDPFDYPEIVAAIQNSFPSEDAIKQSRPSYGQMSVEFDPVIEPVRTMYLYYRWIPDGVRDPYLMITAISSYTVQYSAKSELYIWMVIIAAVGAIMVVISAVNQRKTYQEGLSSDYRRLSERPYNNE